MPPVMESALWPRARELAALGLLVQPPRFDSLVQEHPARSRSRSRRAAAPIAAAAVADIATSSRSPGGFSGDSA